MSCIYGVSRFWIIRYENIERGRCFGNPAMHERDFKNIPAIIS